MAQVRSVGILLIAAFALTLTACGNSSTPAPAGGGSSTSSAAGGAAQIATTDNGTLGTIVVDSQGFTLYQLQTDTSTTSTCTGDCAATWPPATTDGAPTAGSGVDGSLLGTTTRDDGTTQVTYAGHPLYRYSGDPAAGDTNGQGVGGVWYATAADGTAAKDGGSKGGYGGGY